ncbi:hypothetical protein D0866_06917 [Hortaea werneckii]|uniref:Uncharacterized protein n=1 Tax=Hortaea werneckii TaxID=91943 RepID=A0A3M7AXL6_HORWE|nr:hypothetical protein D0866_06917 [Hortaea werneckii]
MGGSAFGPAPVMLVGNKCDRVTEREVSTQEGSALAKQMNCDFVEASAKNCVNVEKAFFDVVRQLRRQRASAPRDSEKGRSHHNDSSREKHRDPDRYYNPTRRTGRQIQGLKMRHSLINWKFYAFIWRIREPRQLSNHTLT